MKADQYGMSIKQFYRDFSLQEINELQALDNMKDEKYIEKLKQKEQEQEIDSAEQISAIKALLMGKVE